MQRRTGEPPLLRDALRCGARTRNGSLCQYPIVNEKKRCRMHGGAAAVALRGAGETAIGNTATTARSFGRWSDWSGRWPGCSTKHGVNHARSQLAADRRIFSPYRCEPYALLLVQCIVKACERWADRGRGIKNGSEAYPKSRHSTDRRKRCLGRTGSGKCFGRLQ